MRHARIEADASDVEEQAAIELAGVHHQIVAVERHGKCPLRLERDIELPRQSVSRPARNNGQRRRAECQRRRDFVDRAVAAPRDDERHAARQRRRRELARMTDAFCEEHFRLDAAPDEHRRRLLGPRPRLVEVPAGARNRVDDDGDADSCGSRFSVLARVTNIHCAGSPSFLSTLGVTNQARAPARREVRLSTSMRQMPPFLNGRARPAPIRCAASSPSPGSWPTSAMRRRLATLASCARTDDGGWPGRQRVENLDRRLALDAGRQQVRRLLGAHQRAREDLVELDVERLETDRPPLENGQCLAR